MHENTQRAKQKTSSSYGFLSLSRRNINKNENEETYLTLRDAEFMNKYSVASANIWMIWQGITWIIW